MRITVRLTTALCASVTATACGGDANRPLEVARADSAGIEIVTTAGPDRTLDWQVEEVLTIDSESTEAGVFEPTSAGLAADDEGRLYALDRGGSRVIVFSPDGSYIHSLGRSGGGPGEFGMALAMVVAPDGRVAVFDGAKQRLVWFARDGAVLPEQEIGAPFFGGYMRQTDAGLLYDHRAGGTGPAMSGVALRANDSTVALVEREDPPTKPIQLESCGMGFTGMPRIFEPSISWDAKGTRLAAATMADYEVRLFDGGDELRRIRRDVPLRTATADLAARDLGEGMRVRTDGGVRICRPDEVVEQRGFAPVIPAVGRLAIDREGGIWVQRRAVQGEDRPIDVFAADGTYLGTLSADTPFPAAFLHDGRYAAVVSDELDVSRIVIMGVNAGDTGPR